MTSSHAHAEADVSELPVHLSRFIGRGRELDELARLLGTTRLLTLTGAGGSGKTRLAREAAANSHASFSRVAWVDFAPIGDGAFVAQQVATALRIHDRPGATPLTLVIETLRGEPALLILDNCEHVVDASAAFVEALLVCCPTLTILATSREALGVASEAAWLVPPMSSDEAVQLFHERARLAMPSFALSDANIGIVAEICRRLDGIPLAIELAAPRVRVLTPEQIARRLDDAFRLLTVGSRTALPRHRTLRATMEWSFALLGAREQVLLRRLAVFAGSFTLSAAEGVCAGEPLNVEDILDGVSALVDKSLVVMEGGEGEARYRFLETVRQYGVERLDEVGERDAMMLRFALQCIDTVEAVAPLIVGGPVRAGLIECLSVEHDNIRAAASWAANRPEHATLALRFVGGLGWFWYALGQFREGRQFADRVLALDVSNVAADVVGRARLSSALTAFFQGDFARAFIDFDAAIPLLRNANDPMSLGTALSKHGAARLLAGEVEASTVILEEAMVFTDRASPNDITRIFAQFWGGLAGLARGDFDTAERLFADTLAIGRAFNLPTTTGHTLSAYAHLEVTRGNVEHACANAAEALEIEVASGDGWGIALALDVIALIAARRGRADDAVRLLGAVDAHRKRIATALPGLAPREREEVIASLRASMSASFDGLYTEGQAWTTDQTVNVALSETARHTSEHRVAAPIVAVMQPTRTGGRLRVGALGSLRVFIGDRAIDATAFGSARPRELLVYLLMHPEGRTKEQVGLAFWPEASGAQLRNNFHVTLHRLRKALGGADWVRLEGERYRIDPGLVEEFDADVFERELAEAMRRSRRNDEDSTMSLERALSRYHGDLLDGEPVGDWHLEYRDRLQRIYLDGLMQLGQCFVADERYAKAAEAYRRVLVRDELHEEAIVALMRCEAAAGERAQALRVYRRFADKLSAELDAEPAEEATALYEQLRQGG